MSLIARDVYKVYKSGAREVRAVDGVSVEIAKGRSVAILGPSGAGKSTLLHILGGLDAPTEGEVILDGVDIAVLTDAERSRIRNGRVGFVFQFYHLLSEFTALENVMLPALICGRPGLFSEKPGHPGPMVLGAGPTCPPRGMILDLNDTIQQRAKDLLSVVGLEDRMTHRPSQLSGGEAQRVAIARALMNRPDYLLCDEPTGNLDSKNSESILDLLFQLKSKSAIALVIVTHDESLTKKTESTIRIKDGKIV